MTRGTVAVEVDDALLAVAGSDAGVGTHRDIGDTQQTPDSLHMPADAGVSPVSNVSSVIIPEAASAHTKGGGHQDRPADTTTPSLVLQESDVDMLSPASEDEVSLDSPTAPGSRRAMPDPSIVDARPTHPVIVSGPFIGPAPGASNGTPGATFSPTPFVPRPPSVERDGPSDASVGGRKHRFRVPSGPYAALLGSTGRRLKFGTPRQSPRRPKRRRPKRHHASHLRASADSKGVLLTKTYGGIADPGRRHAERGIRSGPGHRRHRTAGSDAHALVDGARPLGFSGRGRQRRPRPVPPVATSAQVTPSTNGTVDFNTTMVGTPGGLVARRHFFATRRSSDGDAGAGHAAEAPKVSLARMAREAHAAAGSHNSEDVSLSHSQEQTADEMFAAFLRAGAPAVAVSS